MRRYAWEQVIWRDLGILLFAALITLLFLFPRHRFGNYYPTQNCDGGWADAFRFLASLTMGIVIVEAMLRLAWQIGMKREGVRNSERTSHFGGKLIAPEDDKLAGVLGLVLLAAWLWIGAPIPCESSRQSLFTRESISGSVILAYGLLVVNHGLTVDVAKRKKSPPPKT